MKKIFRKFIGVSFLILALVLSFAPGVAGADVPPKYIFTTIDPPGAVNGFAFDISPGGDVVGNYQSTDNKWHGFLLKHGEFTTLDYPREDIVQIRPGGISPSGDITGFYITTSGTYHGFLLTKKGEWSTVDYTGQPNTALTRILPDGTLIGTTFIVADTENMRAVVMGEHENTILDQPWVCLYGATPDNKVMVGYCKEGPDYAANPVLAYVMDNGVFIPFSFPGSILSMAWDISPDGSTIVGSYFTVGWIGHGFMAKRHGSSVDDWEFITIEVPGAKSTTVHGCNAAGDLVGRYVDNNNKPHLFLASRSGGK